MSLFLVLLAGLHLFRPELDPSWRMISDYELGPAGWLMRLAFFSLALGSGSLAIGLRPFVSSPSGKIGLCLLALSAVSALGGGLFVTDPVTTPHDLMTWHGRLHGLSAMLGIPSFPIAAILLARDLRHQPAWPGRRALLLLTVVASASVTIMLVSLGILLPQHGGQLGPAVKIGWPNRLVVVAESAWLLLIGVGVRRTTRPNGNRGVNVP